MVDQLEELRDRNIRLLAPGDPFGKIPAVFGATKQGMSRMSLRVGIETRTHIESTRKRPLRREKPIRLVYAYQRWQELLGIKGYTAY